MLAAAALALLVWIGLVLAPGRDLGLYGQPAWRALTLPTAACLYAAMTLDSALAYWRGSGSAWKGRAY